MRRTATLFLLASCSLHARAGAFLQPQGQGQIIAQVGFAQADSGYDALGRPVRRRAWRRLEISAYGEYGLTDSVTLIAEPSWRAFETAKAPQAQYDDVNNSKGLGATQLGARVKAWESDRSVFSIQASARVQSGSKKQMASSDLRAPFQGEFRLLYGYNTTFFGMPGFIDNQIAYRSSGVWGPQLRIDATLGVRPFARLLVLLQYFGVTTMGRLGREFGIAQKTQLSCVWEITESTAVQVGFIQALRGVNAARERGVMFGVWTKFGAPVNRVKTRYFEYSGNPIATF